MQLCPLCKGEEHRIFHKYPQFTLIQCRTCQLIYQEELDAGRQDRLIQSIYDANWVAMRDHYAANTLREHASFSAMLLDMFTRKKGRLLEIGSGTGEFLWLAAAAGWQVHGVEPSAVACQYARSRYGLELSNAKWGPDIAHQGECFEAVVFWHVLEHIPDPVSFMSEMKRILAPEGRLMFSLPNVHSLTNALQGNASPIFTETDHLVHYAKEHIEALMQQCGYEIISIFSREEPARLESDLRLHSAGMPGMSENEKIKMMIGLQAGWNGHELFCIAGHRHE